MSTVSRTPSPSSLSACVAQSSVTSSTKSDESSIPEPKPPSTSTFSFGRLLFRNSSSSSKRDSVDSGKDDEKSPATSRPGSPNPSASEKTSQMMTPRRLAGFASRSIRKSQWRLFKHRTFFGSQRNSMKKNQLQPPRLTLRHPSIDSSAMPLQFDVDDAVNENTVEPGGDDFLQIRRNTQRRWTDSETTRKIAEKKKNALVFALYESFKIMFGCDDSSTN
uniref:Uncharacterized protein n=2 Tax=Caenorhabditis japonica TaxID=281687 RepID=A0A8R1EF83_CAEJA